MLKRGFMAWHAGAGDAGQAAKLLARCWSCEAAWLAVRLKAYENLANGAVAQILWQQPIVAPGQTLLALAHRPPEAFLLH